METGSESQHKKATKGTTKRRKSLNNGPIPSVSATDTSDIEATRNAKQPRSRTKPRKDTKRDSVSEEGQSTQAIADENGTQITVGQNDTGKSGVPSIVNMSQNTIPNQSSTTLAKQYPGIANGPPTSLGHQFNMYSSSGSGQSQQVHGNAIQSSPAMNGPSHQYNTESYPASYNAYSSSQYTSHGGKPGMRPPFPGQPRYNGPPSGATPTLNQLLTTPSRYPPQSSFPGSQTDYNQGGPVAGNASSGYWPGSQTRPGQYAASQDQHINSEKHGMNMYGTQTAPQYPGHPQYPGVRNHPGPQRYPTPPTSSAQQYGQQQYPSGMTSNSTHPYGPQGRGYPPHSGAPLYSQPPYGHQQGPHANDPYYGSQQRPPPGYNMPGYQQPPVGEQVYHPHPGKPEAAASHNQPRSFIPALDSVLDASLFNDLNREGRWKDQRMSGTKTPDSVGGSGSSYQQQSGYYMKPTGNVTPQPPQTPGSQTGEAPSPLSVPHPAVSHLRGPPSAPSSPSSANPNRNNPLSPTPVRPSTPHPQMGSMMKSPSSHSDHSQSPMSGYSHGRHMQQHPYGPQPGTPQSGPPSVQNPHQSMMSPPHSMSYPQTPQGQQGHFPSNHTGSNTQIMGPPSSATPGPQKPLSQPSTPGTPQSQGAYGQQQSGGYGMQYPGYGYGPQPMMSGYTSQTPPAERRASWQGSAQPPAQSPQHQMHPHGQPGTPGQYGSPAHYGEGQNPQAHGSGQYPVGHPQYGQGQYAPGQQQPGGPGHSQYPESSMMPASSATTISGAAAAAAAAMAAAAHSAKPRSAYPKQAAANYPPPAQVPPTPSQQPMQPSPQRNLPFHPNYANVQAGPQANPAAPQEGYPQQAPGVSYPPGTPGQMQQPMGLSRTPQHPMQAGAVPQEMGMDYQARMRMRMQHPHMPPQPGYAGYPGQHPNHPAYGPGPGGMMPQGGNYMPPGASSYEGIQQGYEEPKTSTKSSSARSASQKLSALYEGDEPGRKEFIDRVLQYWEDKDLPLKHAPLMGRRTLDLFTLYQYVKKKGFMQEVTRAKEWAEISAAMGLGNSSTSGFTLKKQYCKYLYGFECRVERGEQEPPEALARVSEANRKKKQAAEQQQAKAAEAQMEQRPEAHAGGMPHPHGQPHPGHPMQYGQYPPGHFPQQHPGLAAQMHHPYGNQAMPGQPGQPYPYPSAPGPHGQMPPYTPHQYQPQQQQAYPQPPPRHAGEPPQPGYAQGPPVPTGPHPSQHPQPAPAPSQPNSYAPPPQRPATGEQPQPETKEGPPQSQGRAAQPSSQQPDKASPRKASSEEPQSNLTPSEPSSQEAPSAAPATTGSEEKPDSRSGAEDSTPAEAADKLATDAKSDSGSVVAATEATPADQAKAQDASAPPQATPTEKDQDTPVSATSAPSVAPVSSAVGHPKDSTTPTVTATTAESQTFSATHPGVQAPRPTPQLPYKPSMVSPQSEQRHPAPMSGNFRPPSQPGQQPYYGHPSQHYPGPQRYPGQDPYGRPIYGKSGHDMQRMGYQQRGPPSGHYPFPAGSPAHMRQSPGPPHHMQNSQLISSGPPSRPTHHHQASPSQSPYRPPSSASAHVHPQYSMHGSYPSHHGYPSSATAGSHYPGMKRPSASSDVYGPPNKISRPDMIPPSHYGPGYGRQPPQGQPMYQRGPESMPPGQHYPPGTPGHHPHGPGGSISSTHSPLAGPHPSMSHLRRQHPSLSPANPASVYKSTHDRGGPTSGMKWRHSPIDAPRSHGGYTDSASKCLRGISKVHAMSPHPPSRMRMPQPYPSPSSSHHRYRHPHVYGHLMTKIENGPAAFPLGSVEATHPKLMRMRPKSGRDVGVMEAWRVIMALKSGLLAESTWALNMLTVLLHDQRTIGQIVLSQLPGLLNAIVEHYRCSLKQLFCLPEEIESCFGVTEEDTQEDNAELRHDVELFDIVAKCQEGCSKAKHGKYFAAPKSLQNPFSKRPVKLAKADDANIMDRGILWDAVAQNFPTEDTSHIVATFFEPSKKRHTLHEELMTSDKIEVSEHATRVVEATLEDILSVPSYIRSLEEEDDFLYGNVIDVKVEPEVKEDKGEPEVKKEAEGGEGEKEEVKKQEDGGTPAEEHAPKQDGDSEDVSHGGEETTKMETSPAEEANSSPDKSVTAAPNCKVETGDKSSTGKEIKAEPDPTPANENDVSITVKVESVSVKAEVMEYDEVPLEHKYLHVQSCLERFSKNCDAVLLQDEPAGCPGGTAVMGRGGRYFGGLGSRPLLSKAYGNHETDLMHRVLCLSNIVRSLSCAGINHAELCRHKSLVRMISGTLLLRHKHKTRLLNTEDSAEDTLIDQSGHSAESSGEKGLHDTAKDEAEKNDSTVDSDNKSPAASEERTKDPACPRVDEMSAKVNNETEGSQDQRTTNVFKKPALENGIDAVHKVGSEDGKNHHGHSHELITENVLVAKKKNINDLCRKLRSRSGDSTGKAKEEQKENAKISAHEIVNNVRLKSLPGKNDMHLTNGPDTADQNGVLLHEPEEIAKLKKNHRKLSLTTSACPEKTGSPEERDLSKQNCEASPATPPLTKHDNTESPLSETKGGEKLKRKRLLFSTTVLPPDETSEKREIYEDAWWWECAKQVREDSLVTLANLSMYMNLSSLPDDEAAAVILDSCLHWVVCPSAEAQDSFSTTTPRSTLSPQNLVIEILTKLSMKENNADLILATRPYSRLEKLFNKLVTMVGNRKDQTLREFSIVLLSNLSVAETTAARAIALQRGSISNLIGFLEECEETGLNNRRMFPAGQERVNCGTIPYMMQRCAFTLLTLAKIAENRPLFLKHQLRLLSLSMSSLLDRIVLSLLSSTLFELSTEPGR